VPTQERGKERVAAILDAAEAIIGESGLDRLALTDVASRCGCAIGSVYQYFAGKEPLVEAVVDRLAGEFARVRAGVVAESAAPAPLEQFVPAVLRPVVAFWSEHPATVHLLDRLQAKVASPARALQKSLRARLAAAAPGTTADDASVVTTVTLELVRTALHTLARTPKARRAAVLREFEQVIETYLAAKASSTARGRRAGT
jgi:AcrR family transcriptional regulator